MWRRAGASGSLLLSMREENRRCFQICSAWPSRPTRGFRAFALSLLTRSAAGDEHGPLPTIQCRLSTTLARRNEAALLPHFPPPDGSLLFSRRDRNVIEPRQVRLKPEPDGMLSDRERLDHHI